MKKNVTRRILLLTVAVLLCVACTVGAFAASQLTKKNITVYSGVKIYIDDVPLEPKDVNGNPVDVFVYNGTTYLPARAISEALGKTVQWDGANSTVYVGKHVSDKPAVWLKDLDYFNQDARSFNVYEPGGKDNLGNSYSNEIAICNFNRTYMLNGQYSRLSGTLFQRYEYRDNRLKGTLRIYADDDLIYSAEMASGMTPIQFDVDLTGVLKLQIIASSNSNYLYMYRTIGLGNCGLWT